jgi:hypothetical protein
VLRAGSTTGLVNEYTIALNGFSVIVMRRSCSSEKQEGVMVMNEAAPDYHRKQPGISD